MATTIERNTKGQPEFTNSSDPEWVHNARMEEYRKVLYLLRKVRKRRFGGNSARKTAGKRGTR